MLDALQSGTAAHALLVVLDDTACFRYRTILYTVYCILYRYEQRRQILWSECCGDEKL
jgi:hypothetical protein